jgi:hypothetical protein
MEDNFEFFAPVDDLIKGPDNGKNGIIDVKISGIISDNKEDFDKEEVSQDGLDFSMWKKGYGKLKYEHNKDPKYHIGYPQLALNKGVETKMEGVIYARPGTPQYEIAQQAVGDLQNMMEYNKTHPKDQRRIGFSIEGGVRQRKGNQVLKAVVTNVVLTANPKNPRTYAELIKSFCAGSDINPGDMSGGEAGRKQHLDKTHKTLSVNLKGVKPMKFSNKAEAKKFFIEQGLPEAAADAKAAAWEEANTKEKNRTENYTKSMNTISSALETIKVFSASLEENKAGDTLKKSLEDSLKTGSKDEGIDPMPFLEAIGNTLLTIQKSIPAQNAELTKVLGITLSVAQSELEMIKSLHEDLVELTQDTRLIIEDNEKILKSFEADPGIVTDPSKLNKLDVQKEKETKERKEKIESLDSHRVKSFLSKSIESSKDTIRADAYQKALTRYEFDGFKLDKVEKSIQEEILDELSK